MSFNRDRARGVTELLLRLLIGGIFIFAGVIKVADPILFTEDIRNFRVVGDPWAAVIALGLPWLEIFAGLGLIIRRPYAGSLTLVLGMLFMFLFLLTSALIRGLDIDCGCFGSAVRTSVQTDIITVFVLIFFSLMLIPLAIVRKRSSSMDIDHMW